MQFTPAQQQAITHTAGHLQLVACAGAGKTEVLAQRVAHLLGPGSARVAPEEVVAFTFTERAATELRGRIRARVRAAHGHVVGLDGLFVGTMHAYCLSLLRRHRPESLKCVVLNAVQRNLLIDRHSRECGLTASTDLRGAPLRRHTDTRLYGEAVDLLREAEIDRTRLVGNSVHERVGDYRALLTRRAFIDFAGALEAAVDLLESDGDVRSRIAGHVRHLIVDEYQDSSPLQERLIRALHGLGATLCVVGDDDQTIYQFRGSDVRNIQSFSKRYAGVTTVTLNENFRSSEAIIELGSRVVRPASERLHKEMRTTHAQRFEPGDVTAVTVPTPEAEAEHVVAQMVALRGVAFTESGTTRGIDWSDMAVLFRSVRGQAGALVAALGRHGIPAVVIGMADLFSAPEAAAARTLFQYLGGLEGQTEASVADAWRDARLGLAERALTEAVVYASQLRRRILTTPDGGSPRHEHYGLQRVFWNFLERSGVREATVPGGRGEVVFYNLGRFSQIISDFEVVHFRTSPATKYPEFGRFLQYQAVRAYGEGAPDEVATAPNAVRIMTVHQAKGLQWPVVFLPGLGRNRFPAARVGGRSVWHLVPRAAVVGHARFDGGEDEERRLMYVAVTRAQKFLHLSWAPEACGASGRYHEPSVFFTELQAAPKVAGSASTFAERSRCAPQPPSSARVRSIGYSEFQEYVDCPYAYKLRALCGFNPPLHEALGYGQSLHNALFELHDRWLRGDLVGLDAIPGLVDRHLHLPYAFGELRASLHAAATAALRAYLPEARRGARRIRGAEVDVCFDLTSTVQLNGRLDLLREMPDGTVELVDFKTSHAAATDDAVRTQLRVYAAALGQGGGPVPARVAINDVANGRHESTPVSPTELPPLLAQLRESAARLERGDFSPCGDPRRCERCDFRKKLCPAPAASRVEQAA